MIQPGPITAYIPAVWRIPVRLLQVGAVIAMACCAVTTSPHFQQIAFGRLLHTLSYATVVLLSCLLIALRSIFIKKTRLAWFFMVLGLSIWSLGDINYALVVSRLNPTPLISTSDPLYLSLYPATMIGVVVLVQKLISKSSATLWIDGIIAGTGSTAIISAIFLRWLPTASEFGNLRPLMDMSYPLSDLVLIVIGIGAIGMVRWQFEPALYLITLGAVSFAIADVAHLLDSSQLDHPLTGFTTWGRLGWPLAMVFTAFAAWQRQRHDSYAGKRAAALIIPGFFATMSLAILWYASMQHVHIVARILATASILAMGGRTAVALRQAYQLGESKQQALTDELTGLGNRRLLNRHLTLALQERNKDDRVALLLLDLNGFKEINDSLGHHLGDVLLSQLGPRLRSHSADSDIVVRLGGDEFAILLVNNPDQSGASRAARRLLSALEDPFIVDGVALRINASVGVALCPDHANSAGDLLRRADIAMYQAKSSHRGVEIYNLAKDYDRQAAVELAEQLRDGISKDELVVHYQPQQDLATGLILGVEALVRWQHPTRGLLMPNNFLQLAEKAGLMKDLTLTVLDTALAQCRQWRNEGKELTVSVNLSVSSLLDSSLPQVVSRMLDEHDLPGWALLLEITEDLLMSDPHRAKKILEEIRNLGVSVAIDDYGKGYSSLTYLRNLPVDEIKLDKSFVMSADRSSKDAAIVRSTVELARSLGVRMVAEGVSNIEVRDLLVECRCDRIQGYLLTPPLPERGITTWLQEHDELHQASWITPSSSVESEPIAERKRL